MLTRNVCKCKKGLLTEWHSGGRNLVYTHANDSKHDNSNCLTYKIKYKLIVAGPYKVMK